MAIRPEGLAPCFSSIVSKEIPESYKLNWIFTGTQQTKAIVSIYQGTSTTPLKSITIESNATECSLNLFGLDLKENTEYQWKVVCYDRNVAMPESLRASFYYAIVPSVEDIDWGVGPKVYEKIGSRAYFNLIAENAVKLLRDYVIDSKEEQDFYNRITKELFKGEIVPLKKDFLLIEDVIALLYKKENKSSSLLKDLVGISLGSSDIHKIYNAFNSLLKFNPQPPSSITISKEAISTPTMTSLDYVSSGKEDRTVDLNYNSSSILDKNGTIKLNGFSLSEDISYYVCEFEYGPRSKSFLSELYYRETDLKRIANTIQYKLRFHELYNENNIGTGEHRFSIVAVDKRGNTSISSEKILKHPTTFKTPLGVGSYQVEYQKGALTSTEVVKNGKFNSLYNGASKTAKHTIGVNEVGMYFYRVRYVDKTGLTSDWLFTTKGNKFDPLKVPNAPVVSIHVKTETSLGITWNNVKDATSYETLRVDTNGLAEITSNSRIYSPLTSGKSYTFRVRAKNRVGVSAWVSITGKTLVPPPVTKTQRIPTSDSWRTKFYYNPSRSTVTGGWYPESDKRSKEIYQGMWIELKAGINTDGVWVPKGQTYGNHKSLIWVDYPYWQNELKNKEILEVQLYLKRIPTRHGYPNDGRYVKVWTHNYASRPGGEPMLGNGTEININFERGEGKWITLPKRFGELLRDGQIRGFALHAEFRTADVDKYTYIRFDERETQFRIKYR